MTDKSWKLLTKLINACGYDITQIEDEFDFDELCDDIKNRLAFVNNYSYDCECQQKELNEYKQSLDEKNKFLQDLGISAGGEFKRIKFYIENLKNKYNEKAEECEELISEKDFYLQKIAVLEQEFEQLEEKYEALKLENEEGYEIVDELKHEYEELKAYAQRQENQREEYYKEYLKLSQECEELKEQLQANQPTGICETCMAEAILQNDKYRKTLEEIEEFIKNDFRDDYKVGGVLALIDSYLTENGEFVDERGDFLKAFEDLLDKEHSSGNKTFSISRQILDIINKTKGEGKCQ